MNAQNKTLAVEELEDISSFDALIEKFFGQGRTLFILCDENTQEYCLPLLDNTFGGKLAEAELILVEAGEASKSFGVYEGICETLIELGADRNAVILNLGGGVVTDLGGFVASTFKRGVDFINMPTSLLAMVDAAWGGKNGINIGTHKNQVGSFHLPGLNVLCPVFLSSLAEEELQNGKVEMLKHGLIADANHWKEIEVIDAPSLSQILRSVSIKNSITEKDPKEHGERKKLNFGHSIGHAFESFFAENIKPVAHGRAVAAGLICESYISWKHGMKREFLDEISKKLMQFHRKLDFDLKDRKEIMSYLQSDKKRKGSLLNFTLLTEPGSAIIDQNPDTKLIEESLDYYQKLQF